MPRTFRFSLRHPAAAALGLAFAVPGAQAELLISEYIEGSSNNKALEFYNAGDSTLALDGHRVEFFFNGATASGLGIALTGSLAPGEVHLLVHGLAAPALLALADQRNEDGWFNGDDAVVLYGPDGQVLDSLGQVGVDPGSAWGSGDSLTQNRTLLRRTSVRAGDHEPGDAFDPSVEWQALPTDTFAYAGSYGEGDTSVVDAGQRRIHEVQGSGDSSPLLNQMVTVEGVVVGDFQDGAEFRGFFLQSADGEADSDPLTSEGLFVYDGGNGLDVQPGDRVRVRGLVTEFNGLTELTGALQVSVLAPGLPLPAAAEVRLPLGSRDALERFEGMRISLPQTLTVSEVYDLGRYGEVLLSSGGRQWIPTHKAWPGDSAQALQAENELDRIVLDDGMSRQNPDPIRYPVPELSAYDTLRVGDQASGIQGVLNFVAGEYRIAPTRQPQFHAANPRPAQPEPLDGRLRVASFNVLNYFNGDGRGNGFPTSRGAHSLEEFQRQREKIIAAILATEAHVIGLMEIENDGYAEDSAIADLVNGLNAAAPAGQRYAYIDPGLARLGSDQIAVGLVYRHDRVRLHKAAAVLDGSVDARFDEQKNRPALAQTFREQGSGQRLTVVVNHFKSKGSSCADVGDADTGDGQGNCNLTRLRAARALADWLDEDPTGARDPDVLILGDLNAYAKEDPITWLRGAGYTDLLERFAGDGAYSYVFEGQSGYLDHALASPGLLSQVRGATAWHINADEPRVLDYNLEFKSDRQHSLLYSAEPYRASDHDPLVIGIDLRP